MTTTPDPGPAALHPPALNPAALTGRIIGQTETAIRAVLDRMLADTGTTFHQWVVLQLTAGRRTRPQIVAQLTALGPRRVAGEAPSPRAAGPDGDRTGRPNRDHARRPGPRPSRHRRITAPYGDLPRDRTTRRGWTIVTERNAASRLIFGRLRHRQDHVARPAGGGGSMAGSRRTMR
jgi:hypothetical protein